MLSQVAGTYVNKGGAETIVKLIFDRLQQVIMMTLHINHHISTYTVLSAINVVRKLSPKKRTEKKSQLLSIFEFSRRVYSDFYAFGSWGFKFAGYLWYCAAVISVLYEYILGVLE